MPRYLTNLYLERAIRFARKIKLTGSFDRLKEKDERDRKRWIHYAAIFQDSTLGEIMWKVFKETRDDWDVADEKGPNAAPAVGVEDKQLRQQFEQYKAAQRTKSFGGANNWKPSKKGGGKGAWKGKPGGGKNSWKGKVRQSDFSKLPKTVKAMMNGNNICGDYNNAACTAQNCGKGLHLCNGLIPGGQQKACAAKDHISWNCPYCERAQ